MDKIRVMIVDDHDETRELVKKILSISDEITVAMEAKSGLESVSVYTPDMVDVILMDINMPEMNGLEAADRISSEHPDSIIVMMSVQNEAEYLRKAMDSGARSYIVKPFDLDTLSETIINAYYKNKKTRVTQSDINRQAGQILSFYGSKGGVGKSVLAMNTAVLLSQEKNTKVILVDLDMQFGDVGMLMNIKPKSTIYDALSPEAEDFQDQVTASILNHSDQLDVLLAPKRPDQAEGIQPAEIKMLLVDLKSRYDYILVDLGTNYSEISLTALDISNKVFYITTPDMLSIKNTRLGLEVMKSLEYDLNKLFLVINRWTGKEKIKIADIERALDVKVDAQISDERRHMLEMINRGDPLAGEKRMRKSKFMKDMKKALDILRS